MSLPRPRRAVVFDLDGTLLDSLPLVLAAITHALEPFAKTPPRDLFARLGGPPQRFLASLVDDVRHVPLALERMEAFHRANARLIQPHAGAIDVLEQLHGARMKLAIWTGRDRVSTEWLLRDHRLEHYFSALVCGDDLPTHKPDPAGLRALVERLDVAPAEVLFVGDADVDVLGGVAAGVDTLLIESGRVVPDVIRGQSWRVAASAQEAFTSIIDGLDAAEPGRK